MARTAVLVGLLAFVAVGTFGWESIYVLSIFGLLIWVMMRREKKVMELVHAWLQQNGYAANDAQMEMSPTARGSHFAVGFIATDAQGNRFRVKLNGSVGSPLFFEKPSVECQFIEAEH